MHRRACRRTICSPHLAPNRLAVQCTKSLAFYTISTSQMGAAVNSSSSYRSFYAFIFYIISRAVAAAAAASS